MRTPVLALLFLSLISTAALAQSQSIVEIATSNRSFRTLTAALKQADLVKALQADGPFTVFAPTDAAFAKLPKGTVESLLKPENREQLVAILTFHVVPGRVTAGEALLAKSASTLQGSKVAFAYDDGALRAGPAKILKPDILATNGVIHVIDTVLLPPSKKEAAREAIQSLLTTAIDRGVPQFNDGNPAACAAIYEIAARGVLTLGRDSLSGSERRALDAAIADSSRNDTDRAWALRRAFDRILTAEAPKAQPKKTAFKPIIEAALPEGFPAPGPVGEVVVKTYPRYRMARAKGGMFAFGTLFNHIKRNKIDMTAPVEMTMQEQGDGLAQKDMAFLYASTKLGETGEQGRVEVTDVKDARVLSYGIRGPMTKEKIATAKATIEKQLGSRWARAGEWRMMGYNSPMVSPDKRFWEIQLPIRPLANS